MRGNGEDFIEDNHGFDIGRRRLGVTHILVFMRLPEFQNRASFEKRVWMSPVRCLQVVPVNVRW